MILVPPVSVSQNKFLEIANKGSNIIGLPPVPSVSEITDRAVLREACSVSANPSYPLYDEFKLLPSARCFITKKCVKNKFKLIASRELNANWL